MRLFEYIYFRIAKFYYKRDGRDAFGAIAIISIIQGLLLVDLTIVFLKVFVSVESTEGYGKLGRIMGGVLAILIMILNYRIFRNKYWRLADRWRENETPAQRKVRGWLVVLSILAPFAILILLGTV